MTDVSSLLGLREDEAVQVLEAGGEPWILERCSAFRERSDDCVQRVVRARTRQDGTVEVTLSGFCDYPRGSEGAKRG